MQKQTTPKHWPHCRGQDRERAGRGATSMLGHNGRRHHPPECQTAPRAGPLASLLSAGAGSQSWRLGRPPATGHRVPLFLGTSPSGAGGGGGGGAQHSSSAAPSASVWGRETAGRLGGLLVRLCSAVATLWLVVGQCRPSPPPRPPSPSQCLARGHSPNTGRLCWHWLAHAFRSGRRPYTGSFGGRANIGPSRFVLWADKG